MSENTSRSKALGTKLAYEAMKILQERGGEAKSKDVISELDRRVPLDDWAREIYSKTGYTRWVSILHFHTIGPSKAGFLRKNKGIWYLTKEGEEALPLGADAFARRGKEAYRQWREQNPKSNDTTPIYENNTAEDDSDGDESDATYSAMLEDAKEHGAEGIRQRIYSLNPYAFQDLVAALLGAMGYYTPFVAPKGRDGGVDIVAYQDPIGAKTPRIKVQVKHRPNTPANVQELRELVGLLGKAGDIGLFISSGGFTADAKQMARTTHVHVELLDLDRLIELWQDFYQKMDDEQKEHLRLAPVYFYDPMV